MSRISVNKQDKDAVTEVTRLYNTIDGIIGFEMPLIKNKSLKKQHDEIMLPNPSKLVEVPNHPYCIPNTSSKIEPYLFCLFIQLREVIMAGKDGKQDNNESVESLVSDKVVDESNYETDITDIAELDNVDILGYTSILSSSFISLGFDELLADFLDFADLKYDIDNETVDLMRRIYGVARNQSCQYVCYE
jgi:hypothetical protein